MKFVMESTVQGPSWMDKSFFTTVIKHHTSDAIAEVKDYSMKATSTPGESFASAIFFATIKYSTKLQSDGVLSVVIKIVPVSDMSADLVNNLPIFDVEQDVYNGPINDIKSLLESVGDFCHIQPKLIYQSTKPHPVIVLEDLTAAGYEKISQPLEDFEDTKMVFQRLAKFHAASYFLINEKKADYSRFKFSVFKEENPMIREIFLCEPIDVFIEVLESWVGYEVYVEKLKAFRETFIDMGKRLYDPDVNGYNVLNHGDFHIKNLLFKKNGDNIEDFYMMDFQISVLASPCIDLFYALYNSISDENRTTRRNEIIHYYHSEFSAALKHFGFIGKIPSLLDLQMNLIKHGQMEVVKCICFKYFFWTNANEVWGVNEGEHFDSKEVKRKIFNNESFKKFIKAELPRLLYMGFL